MGIGKFVNQYSSNGLTYDETYDIIETLLIERLFSCFQEKVFKIKLDDYDFDADGTLISFARVEIYFKEKADPMITIDASDVDLVEKALEAMHFMTPNELSRDLQEYKDNMRKTYPELKEHAIGYKQEKQDNWSNGLDLLKSLW